MDKKLEQEELQKELWQESNRAGSAVIIYKAVMTVVIIAVMISVIIISLVNTGIHPIDINTSAAGESLTQPDDLANAAIDKAMASMGWSYLLAMVICAAIFLLWKKKAFFVEVVMHKRKKMTGKVFLLTFSFFMICQFLGQISSLGFDALLNHFGKSASNLIEASTANTTDSVMILYVGVLAPIMEELLFRGIVLRGMLPFGKGIAVFTSSILFGMIHANPVQIPFAFATGIVLAYITLEYDIRWAILLHAINNFGLGIVLPVLLSGVPVICDLILGATIIGGTIIAIVSTIIQKAKIKEEFATLRTEKWQWKIVMTSPTILIALITSVTEMLFLIAMTAVSGTV